ncbi:MAG: 2Fe-2S iron-sulfur cluster-binding protein [Thiotrichales bacterium]|nr:2Fe-2S iron-sulfur cluster-binding protein [Thiotrichales bacterium]
MKTIRLTVNGESSSATIAGRTQLAELLRDHLHLTGTHLGCEHGVCGACTVLVDGKPIRSCITYAQACEDASVVTVEGLGDDPIGRALREAFTRHHAVQCGFCTSGMLITAWDIVTRLAPTSEAEIRRELSGNLCRCTGYVGIVAAVQDVARRQRNGTRDGADAGAATDVAPSGEGTAAAGTTVARGAEPRVPPATPSTGATAETRTTQGDPDTSSASSKVSFEPFEVDPVHLGAADSATHGSTATGTAHSMTQAGGWSRIEREFVIGYPVDALWTLFEDLPRVAECLPGVHVESAGADHFAGRAEIRFGPIGAAFHGEGTREIDAARRTGVISGHGSDPRGHATLDSELRYEMSGEESDHSQPRTRVQLAIRFRIQGTLAQFNRGDLVESFADVVLSDFVRNCERRLAGEEPGRRADPSGFALLWRLIRARLGF